MAGDRKVHIGDIEDNGPKAICDYLKVNFADFIIIDTIIIHGMGR